MPLAVPGRWRTITEPAVRTFEPFGRASSPAAGVTPLRRELRAQVGQRMRTEGEMGAGVVRPGLLDGGHLRQRRRLRVGESVEQGAGGLAEAGRLPERGAAGETERGEGAHGGEVLELVLLEVAAADEVLGIREGRLRLLDLDRDAGPRPQASDEPEAEADGAGGRMGIARAVLPAASDARVLDVHRPDLDAVALGVLDQGRRMVEAHGPGVQQPEIEGGGVVGLELGAGVGDQGEARGVRFGEAVEGEGGDALHDLLLALPEIPRSVMPRRRRPTIACIRSTERLEPMARRSSSASPPVKPAATMAMRRSCSWKIGTPSVRSRIGSRLGCG